MKFIKMVVLLMNIALAIKKHTQNVLHILHFNTYKSILYIKLKLIWRPYIFY